MALFSRLGVRAAQLGAASLFSLYMYLTPTPAEKEGGGAPDWCRSGVTAHTMSM